MKDYEEMPSGGGMIRSTETLSFRPARQPLFGRQPLWLVGLLAAVFMLPAFYKLIERGVQVAAAVAIVAAVILGAVGLGWAIARAWFGTAELVIHGDRVIYRSLVRRTTIHRASIARLVRGTVREQHIRTPDSESEQLLLLDGAGRCLLRMGPEWPESRIARALNLHLEQASSSVITAREAVSLYPGSYSWLVSHPSPAYLASLGAGLLLFVIFVLVLALRSS